MRPNGSPGPAFGPVVIDVFPESVARYRRDHAVVAVDVFRATTMAVTAVAQGRRCIVATSVADAFAIRQELPEALLAGELGGDTPDGFEMNNSPADLVLRADVERPLVMVSSSGTRVMTEASGSDEGAYVASLRNLTATARHLIGRHERIAVIGAGSRGSFREEDQMACAWIAEILIRAGHVAADEPTQQLIDRWTGASVAACQVSESVAYLGRSGQLRDYDFVVATADDLDLVCAMTGNEVRAGTSVELRSAS